MKGTRTPEKARPASTWIERFALPLAIAAMEAQPMALVIALLTLVTAGTLAAVPVGAGGIALAALGLLWWAMIAEHIIRGSTRGRRLAWLHLLGWLVAFAAIAGPRLASLPTASSIFAVLLDVILITWLWRRGMSRAQAGFEYGRLAASFKIGFGVLLGMLLIVIVVPLPEQDAFRDILANALPLFFLTGLVGLSLTRLGAIRSTRLSSDGSQADPTRVWLLALSILGVTMVVVVIVLEAIFSFTSFEVVLTALTPLWNALGTLLGWLIYGIVFLLTPIFYLNSFLVGLFRHQGTSQPPPPITVPKPPKLHQPAGPTSLPPEVLAIGRWVFLAFLVLAVLLVIGRSLRRWYTTGNNEGVEEVREQLDARSLLGQRWRQWRNRRRQQDISPLLEPLDPTSARFRYREMLQAAAMRGDDLKRRSAETPSEYQGRLLVYFEKHLPDAQDHTDDDQAPGASAILKDLTEAYINERYGGKDTNERRRRQLQTWVPHLLARLTGKTATSPSPRRARS